MNFRAIATLIMAAGVFASAAQANVIIGGTRVIYPGNEREVTVRLTNEGEQPALVRTWIDKGDPKMQPDAIDVPFLLSPPVFRLDSKKGQVLRLAYTHDPLPEDRESVFWLNVLEIPPKPVTPEGAESANMLQFAIRSRIKLFYRPSQLAGDAQKAPEEVQWTMVPTSDKKGYELQLFNPTPYHLTFIKVAVSAGAFKAEHEGGMIAPRTALTVPLPGLQVKPSGLVDIEYITINDFGALVPNKRSQLFN